MICEACKLKDKKIKKIEAQGAEKMTIEERLDKMKEIMEEIYFLSVVKGKDYNTEEDCMENLRDFGWKGCIMRMGDKHSRLSAFAKKNKFEVKDESFEDTVKDLINYALFALILYRDNKSEKVIESNLALTAWKYLKLFFQTCNLFLK